MKKIIYFSSISFLIIFILGYSENTEKVQEDNNSHIPENITVTHIENHNKNSDPKNEELSIHFLGTGAAEGFPNPFCLCDACVAARELGGENIRSRTSVLIDNVLLMDFTTDYVHQAITQDMDLTEIQELLITNAHEHNFNTADFYNRITWFAHDISVLDVYGSSDVTERLSVSLPDEQVGVRFSFNEVEAFEEAKLETATIVPLAADHVPPKHALWDTPYMYFIERKGKKILYGNDTGWFPDETWDWLKGIDVAILNNAFGYNEDKNSENYMSIETVIETQKRLKEENMIAEDGVIVVTNFSHDSGLMHDELVEIYESYGIIVAYDGMVLNVE